MDKQRRNLRRGVTRLKQSSGHSNKLFSCVGGGGDFVFSGKSKRERLRKLSALEKVSSSSFEDCEMGCDVSSDREDELPAKRFKLPKKFFHDYNGVGHATVPRKLRSAMKKRIRESVSPPLLNSKKMNHTMSEGIESTKRNDIVINHKAHLKHGGSDKPPRETVRGDMTKDEEEVAETLYYLAGLIPNNDANDHSNLSTKPSASPQSKESPTPALEVGNDKSGSICPLRATEAPSPSSVESLTKETDHVDSLNKTSTQHEPEFPNCRKLSVNSDSSVPQNLNVSALSAKVEQCNEKLTVNAVNFGPPSDLNMDGWLTQLVQKEPSLFQRKPETPLQLGTTNGSQGELHDIVQESKNNGPVLWPGLSLNVSHGARNDSPSSHSSPPAKIPFWPEVAFSTSRASVRNRSSFEKVTKVVNGRRSCKQCAAHVYISYLIQGLQNLQSKDKLHPQPNPTRTHEGSKLGAVPAVNIYTEMKNGPTGSVSASSTDISIAQEYLNEAKNRTLQQGKLHQDQSQSTMESEAYTWPKQSFDFLSLSAGGCGRETNDSFSKAGNRMELSSQSQVPYMHSLMQHHSPVPFSLPQSHYSSSCSNNSSVAQQAQMQLRPYHGNPYVGPQASLTALTKQQSQQQHLQLQQQQQQHQQHQHQQRLWAAHFAAQYRPAGTASSAVHYASWQNARQETTLIPCGQALMSPSPSTLELVGPKYAALSSQQQQRLMAVTSSFPPGRGKLQDHHGPSVYEEYGGGFRARSAQPLQLLCNDRLQ